MKIRLKLMLIFITCIILIFPTNINAESTFDNTFYKEKILPQITAAYNLSNYLLYGYPIIENFPNELHNGTWDYKSEISDNCCVVDYSAWVNYTGKIFDEKYIDKILKTSICLYEENGIYFLIDNAAQYEPYQLLNDFADKYKIISESENAVVVSLPFKYCYTPYESKDITLTVELTNTADVWRVSGGTFLDVLYNDSTPDTSDNIKINYMVFLALLTAGLIIFIKKLINFFHYNFKYKTLFSIH